MNPLVLACETLRDEITHVMRLTACSYDVKWIESGLHNSPGKLHMRLQEELNEINNYDQVLLGFGQCGKATSGLKSGNFELIMPNVDDCLTLLLGSADARKRISEELPTYFLTRGWLRGERNIWREYEYAISKYGPQNGKLIMASVLSGYKRLGLIDVNAADLPALTKQTIPIAERLGLAHAVIPGSTDYLEEWLTGTRTKHDFIIIPPHSEIGFL